MTPNITGGNVTVFVSDMDRAVTFYTGVLELKLTNRFGNDWATVDAGKGFIIGLHPASKKYPAPGTKGAMMIGLEVDGPIERVLDRLSAKGLHISRPVERGEAGNFVHLEDPDGNELYLWEVNTAVVTQDEDSLALAER